MSPDLYAIQRAFVVKAAAALRATLRAIAFAGITLFLPCAAAAQEWIDVHADLVTGTDRFHAGVVMAGKGRGMLFAERNEPKLENSRRLLSELLPEFAAKIGRENAIAIYRLKD